MQVRRQGGRERRRPEISRRRTFRWVAGHLERIEEKDERRDRWIFKEATSRWGQVQITDPCHESAQDWSFGKACIKTDILSVIQETVDVVFDMNLYKVRVIESGENIFFPCVSYPDDQSRIVNSDREDEEEEDDHFLSSDGQSSGNFSDGEDEASFGDQNGGNFEENNGNNMGQVPITENRNENPSPLKKDEGPFLVDPNQNQTEAQEDGKDIEKVFEILSKADNTKRSVIWTKKEKEGYEKLQEEKGNLGESELEEFGEEMGFRAQNDKKKVKRPEIYSKEGLREARLDNFLKTSVEG
ncbi:hypothetical protein L2E82_47620 [Cichorium intybus]|uniref:Uncharacterized protein n=1 Tax=Cichorium intybus TaxID=13427 RepID=A0ACB8YWP7_CICIN|nr:hypothetical protein L2E82_47620 [Cichorium intybus]